MSSYRHTRILFIEKNLFARERGIMSMADLFPGIIDLSRKRLTIVLLTTLLIFGLLIPAQGHVPLMNDGNGQGALIIPDALKSWAIYGVIHEKGEVDRYQFDLQAGDRLVLNLLVPPSSHFTPSMVIIGPGVPSQGSVPQGIIVPSGSVAMVVEGKPGNIPSYEPFTPTSIVKVASVDTRVTAPGSYTVVVYGDGTGPYGLAVGYLEEFSPSEWLLVPLSVIGIRFWEGQSPVLVFGPTILVLAAGLAIFIHRKDQKGPMGLRSWSGIIGGLLCIGSGVNTLLQMGIALQGIPVPSTAAVTLVFALIPILIGIAALRISDSQDTISAHTRAKLIVLGIVGFISWSGFLVGPLLLCISACIPEK